MDREYIISTIIAELIDSLAHTHYLTPKEKNFLAQNLYPISHILAVAKKCASNIDYAQTQNPEYLVDDYLLRKLSLPEESIDEAERTLFEFCFFYALRKVADVVYYETNGDFTPDFIAGFNEGFIEKWLIESIFWNAMEKKILTDIASRAEDNGLSVQKAAEIMLTKELNAASIFKNVQGEWLEMAIRELLYKDAEDRRYPITLINAIGRL